MYDIDAAAYLGFYIYRGVLGSLRAKRARNILRPRPF